MSRFMQFINILELVKSFAVPEGLIIKCVKTDERLILKTIKADGTDMLAFMTEERELVQCIEPTSVWELINIPLEGDVVNEL